MYHATATGLSMLLCFAPLAVAQSRSFDLPFAPHNVILITVDDIGVDMIGAYEEFYPPPELPNRTPVIDWMAQSGILFRNAWTNPSCSPSRAQILTGQHAFHTGIGQLVRKSCPPRRRSTGAAGWGLQAHLPTIPSMLRDPSAPFPAWTVALGKWHLMDGCQFPPLPSVPPLPLHPLGSQSNPWFHAYAGHLDNLTDYNEWNKVIAGRITWRSECRPRENESYCESIVFDYATRDTTDDAVQLIETLPEPFFLQVNFHAAHSPLDSPARTLEPSFCAGGAIAGDPDCAGPRDRSRGEPAVLRRCLVQWLDNELGRLFCSVEDSRLAPDHPTTIILIGDNGTPQQAAVAPFDQGRGFKGTLYEGGIHVPLIVKSPLLAPELVGTSTAALVTSTDLLDTISQLTHAPPPEDPYGLRDSISFVPVLRNPRAASPRRFAYAEAFAENFVPDAKGQPPASYELNRHRRAIRDCAGFKLVQVVTRSIGGIGGDGISTREEFYHVTEDPFELIDLYDLRNTPQYAPRFYALLRELETTYPTLVK